MCYMPLQMIFRQRYILINEDFTGQKLVYAHVNKTSHQYFSKFKCIYLVNVCFLTFRCTPTCALIKIIVHHDALDKPSCLNGPIKNL